MLTISGVFAGYGGGDVLQGLDLEVPTGAITCIVGPNGAGKSTVLRVVSGLLTPRLGTDRPRRHAARPARLRRSARQGRRAGAAVAGAVPADDDPGERAARRLHAAPGQAAAGQAVRPGQRADPDRGRARERQGRQPVRRPAPHGRDRALPDGRPERAAARRAVARAGPEEPDRGLRAGARRQCRRDDGAAGRAERAPRPEHGHPRRRPRGRPGAAGGAGRRAHGQPRGRRALPRRARRARAARRASRGVAARRTAGTGR